MALRDLANSLPKPYRFRPAGDLATEIEWAKNRRLTPTTYRGELDDHEPPVPADLIDARRSVFDGAGRAAFLVGARSGPAFSWICSSGSGS